jgi:uncharacterized membrane protein YhaH (DUF805 family)
MDFGTAIKTCFNKYADFEGKAIRSEYWYWFLFCWICGALAIIIDVFVIGIPFESFGPAYLIVSLAVFLPTLAAGARRLHDIGKSGWWQLISLTGIGIILLIVWWATEGTTKGYTGPTKTSTRDYDDTPKSYSATKQRSRSGKVDVIDELEELKELYEDGTLSEVQFKKAKKKLLK